MTLRKYLSTVLPALICSISVFAQNAVDTTVQFKVWGVCGQCEQRIEDALKIKGITSASWNQENQMLTATFNPAKITLQQIHRKMAAVGHDTELEKATDKVYQALPACCHYREIDAHHDDGDEHEADENHFQGIVVEDNMGQTIPLAGATIMWAGSKNAVKTSANGVFMLPKEAGRSQLVVSYSGFKTDTISVENFTDVQITLNRNEALTGIVVTARKKTTFVDGYNPFRTAVITKKELLKAACCNLSESFETNPSVDVAYNDAATGSKQIQLLGLAGVYTQLTVENLPGPRGLATPLGLNSIAGPWVQSIQLIKGAGSVVNGFESIAGQINVELKKPENSEKLYLNGYVNSSGKTDINLNLSHKINSRWGTSLLLHDDFLYHKQDANKDGFRDLPTGNQFSGVNRWEYIGDNGLMSEFGIKALIDEKVGGEVGFDPSQHKNTTNHYGLGINTHRYEAFAKTGYVFPEKTYKSIGLQLSAFNHQQDAYFGLTKYHAHQKNFYSNLIYQSQIKSAEHNFKTGLSFLYDQYNELLNASVYKRTEVVPGAFAEYTFSPNEKLDVVAGIRADHNSLFGWFGTPRLNIRYAPFFNTTIRVSAGRGQRTANIFAENVGVLVSSRTIQILSATNGKAYGLQPEVAWNKGISIDQKLTLFSRAASVAVDFFRNDFSSQVVVDVEDPRQVKFYNLDGKSFSNSFQAEMNLEPVEKLDLRLAYRYFDVRSTYGSELLEKPLSAKHRAFANLGYDLMGWKLDYTVNWVGKKRLPSTQQNPEVYRLAAYAPAYVTMNAQVSKSFGKNKLFDAYVGAENLGNFVQQNAIIAGNEPFSPYFDASLVWGPISERMFYAGFRYTIK